MKNQIHFLKNNFPHIQNTVYINFRRKVLDVYAYAYAYVLTTETRLRVCVCVAIVSCFIKQSVVPYH